MRLTRPGARPCHATGCLPLGLTQLRGLVLCARIDDESAGAELRSRQVLELVARAVGRIELDMEVMVVAGAARRGLVHRHHIRQGAIEKPVVLLQQPLQDSRERLVVVGVESAQSLTTVRSPCTSPWSTSQYRQWPCSRIYRASARSSLLRIGGRNGYA